MERYLQWSSTSILHITLYVFDLVSKKYVRNTSRRSNFSQEVVEFSKVRGTELST